MNKYIKKYQRIIDGLIKRSFPELKGKRVIAVEVPKFFLFYSFAQKNSKGYYIFINKMRRKTSIKSLTGQLAHELCHIVLDHRNKTVWKDLLHNIRKFLSIIFNTKFSRAIETKIDRETIRRGYAKELAAIWEKSVPKIIMNSLYARGYLIPAQIKAYAKKIGKWH